MDRKEPKKYTAAQMAKALLAAKMGMPVATASKRFGVPRITLRNKLKGISPEVCNMGPPTVLTADEEDRIVKWIIDIARAGFPVTKQCLVDTVTKLIKELDRKLHLPKTSEKLTGYRGQLTEIDIRNWFQEVSNYFKDNGYSDILEHAHGIFNADETAISLCPKSGKVLAPKGDKNIYSVSKTSEKENLTVLLTVSASGEICPPMVVYLYKRVPADIVTKFPKSWGLGKSANGWMTGEVFFEYMANIFEPWLTENNIERSVIFFVDGHKSHLTLHLSIFLREKQIILVVFYPNATHVLQPLDVSVFYPLKCQWKSHVRKWLAENENQPLMRHHVATLLENILNESISPAII
ncbi:uncharacterized protein [Diabrotica undecimpunctata]|uniref:uncharacterized protein n=1 Tax=Diabrotica undecimpunctata TaxID=50387 RepID=UPI003B63DE7F